MLANFFPYEIHSLEHIFSKKNFFFTCGDFGKVETSNHCLQKIKKAEKNFKINFFCA